MAADTLPLPPAAELIDAAREAMRAIPDPPGATEKLKQAVAKQRRAAANRILDQWAPAIDQMTDSSGAAAFMGYASGDTIRRLRRQTRADGTRGWPEPDTVFGWQQDGPSLGGGAPRAKMQAWKFRTIVLAKAEAPGRGAPGRPGRREDWHATHVTPRQG
jgi:hypothetical protein